MKKALALSMIILLILVTGCGGNSTPTKVEKTSEMEQLAQSSEEIEALVSETPSQVEIFSIGETVSMGNFEFTVNSLRFDKGSTYMTPDAGEKWLVIDSTIVNKAQEPEAISSMLMFSLMDSEFYVKNMAFGPELKGSMDGEIAPGRTLRGEIAYNVSDDETNWEFIFEPDPFGKGQAIYKLSLDDM